DDLKDLEAVSRVRNGQSYSNKLVLIEGKVFQAAGVPIRTPGKTEVIGGIVLGLPIQRSFEAFQKQSDALERDQLRRSLVRGDEVLASSFPPNDWDDLTESLHPEKRLKAKDGSDTIEILAFENQTWDFYNDQVAGYAGSERTSNLGTIYIMKSRATIKEHQSFWFAGGAGIVLALLVSTVLAGWISRP